MVINQELKDWYELVKARQILERHNINSLGQINAREQQLRRAYNNSRGNN